MKSTISGKKKASKKRLRKSNSKSAPDSKGKQSRFGDRAIVRKIRRIVLVIGVNFLLLAVLLGVVEMGYRLYRDGFPEAFENLLKFGGVPYSNLGTKNWAIYDERLGYRLNPNGEKINRFSIRIPEIEVPKPAGRYRILVLGDSVPWDRPGFVQYIRERLKPEGNFEVINAGVPGYTAYQEVLFFKEYLQDIDADLVIWTYCPNDNHKFLHRFDEKGKMLFTDEAKESLYIHPALDRYIGYSYVLTDIKMGLINRQQSKEEKKARFIWETKADFNIAWKEHSFRDYAGYLSELADMLSADGKKLGVVVFPYEPQLDAAMRFPDKSDYIYKPQRLLSEIADRYDVPVLDLKESFRAHISSHRGRLYRDGIHLNPAGHDLAADEILKFIRAKGLLSP